MHAILKNYLRKFFRYFKYPYFKETLGQYKIKDEACGFPGIILSTVSVSTCKQKASVGIYSESFNRHHTMATFQVYPGVKLMQESTTRGYEILEFLSIINK